MTLLKSLKKIPNTSLDGHHQVGKFIKLYPAAQPRINQICCDWKFLISSEIAAFLAKTLLQKTETGIC
jgi:hypothetical protein